MSQPQPQMPNPTPYVPDMLQVIEALQRSQQDLTKMMITKELIDLKQLPIKIAGEEQQIINQELLTEHSGAKATKYMVKISTYRKSVQDVYHMKNIDQEHLIGYMHDQVIIKMVSHRRKRPQEVVNAIRNELAGTEVIPQNTKKKKFLGII